MDDHRYPLIIIITSQLPICSGFLSCYFFLNNNNLFIYLGERNRNSKLACKQGKPKAVK